MEMIYFAGGCLWGVQEFLKTLNGVVLTEAGRANGTSNTLDSEYDLRNYVKSAEEHQDRLERFPEDNGYCHIPKSVMYKHKRASGA